jgi:AraC-like DNA-binding protein
MDSKGMVPAGREEATGEVAQPFTTKAWMPLLETVPPIAMAAWSKRPSVGSAMGLPTFKAPVDKGFRADTADHLRHIIETRLAATCLKLQPVASVDAWANFFQLPGSELFFCSYGAPIRLEFSDSDYVRFQFQHVGSSATSFGRQVIPVSAQQSCISPAAATIDFGADFQQLVWRIPRSELIRKLAALTAVPITRRLEFDSILPRGTPQSNQLMQLLSCLITTISHMGPHSNRLLITELEQALMVALLCGTRHTLQDLLDRDGGRAAPWQVRRAEEFIASHLDQPLRIELIATAAGTSARSLHRAFRQSRGYSPMEFARQQRMLRARRMLQERVAGSVTEVCFACGFGDISHFSKEFTKTFGESPSSVLGDGPRAQGACDAELRSKQVPEKGGSARLTLSRSRGHE